MKWTLLGTFSVIGALRFPAVHERLGVYFAVTDGRGKIPMSLRMVDVAESEPPLFSLDFEIESPDPRSVTEAGIEVPALQFEKPGEYRVQLFAAGEFLIERRIVVVEVKKP
jgi:hypothetical protein